MMGKKYISIDSAYHDIDKLRETSPKKMRLQYNYYHLKKHPARNCSAIRYRANNFLYTENKQL